MPLGALFYDTSILNNFAQSKNKLKFEETFALIQKKGFLKPGDYFTISTPLLTLEVLGLGDVKKFFRVSSLNCSYKEIVERYIKESTRIEDAIAEIFTITKNELVKIPVLQSESLLNLAMERSIHSNEWWKKMVFELFLKSIGDKDYIEWFHENLALEFIQDIDFESIIDFKSLIKFNTEWFHYFNHLQRNEPMNTVFCRRVLKYFHRKMPSESGFISSGSDMADSLIIHYSLLGYKTNNYHRVVKTITCETKEKTRKRLLIYHGALKHINEFLPQGKSLKFLPGVICHVNPTTGKIASFTYVQKEIDCFTKNENLAF